jgi:FMN phosphatase YigB (HAD superfamily)
MDRYNNQRIKAVLSDAGGVLFDYSIDTQIEPLRILLEKTGKKLSLDRVYSLYLPYLYRAQTIVSEEEAIEQFLCDNNCHSKFADYEQIRNTMKSENRKKLLYEGVTETLEILRDMKIDFYVVTNAKAGGVEFEENFEMMLITQLKERNSYNPEMFNLSDYIRAIISSKDLGVRKPDAHFFNNVLSFERRIPLKRDEVIFIAHNSDEIFDAADLGISVIAFNYQKEKDAYDIMTRIHKHNERYTNGQISSRIYRIEKFIEIPTLVRELSSF